MKKKGEGHSARGERKFEFSSSSVRVQFEFDFSSKLFFWGGWGGGFEFSSSSVGVHYEPRSTKPSIRLDPGSKQTWGTIYLGAETIFTIYPVSPTPNAKPWTLNPKP